MRPFICVCSALSLLSIGCHGAGSAEPAPLAVRGAPVARSCHPAATFADERTPARIRHVSTTGSDVIGNGSAAQPFSTIARAGQDIAPGTAVYVHAGTYPGGTFLTGLHGTDTAPIWIMGAPGETRPVIKGGSEGVHLIKPRYVAVMNLEIADTADNGINVDDGDDFANPDAARFVLFRDLDVHDTGKHPSGVANCLKLSGLNDFVVLRSSFARCGDGPGSGAVGVDGVGVHRGVVSFSRFDSTGFGGLQFKGASSDIEIRSNVLIDTGWRGVNMGGSTGEAFFRPPLDPSRPNYEAARIQVVANTFTGSETAAAFAGCVDCRFVHNTVVDPSKWALRILQETTTNRRYTFTAASNGLIVGNVFYFRRAALDAGEDINVGNGTQSGSFAMIRNLWYAHDNPTQSGPRIPAFKGSNVGAIAGTDPDFVDASAGDFRLKGTSAAKAAGSMEFVAGSDAAGHCYANPPSLGAFEFTGPLGAISDARVPLPPLAR